ncbi:ABC transporter substrate-binding protein [Allorhizobium sp. BGMRC 0089]|uniref:ABC transporter substrate-binding protein n=1 Tax=Allorhizobium sonneratiae TaxID=2934936 RepID=UPI002033EAE7|nr:ABC transporter substrate-binding protein [Allorhizobium sonneratiae]MCM2293084.1 ABC transporter substrate-binding protein [Allorhizobium sonneratiae]
MRLTLLCSAALACLATVPAAAETYKEAPMLDALVKAGKLPPVEARLPQQPLVETMVERVGVYGGERTGGMVGGNDRNMLAKLTGYEPLMAWDREWSGKIIPNVALGYTASPDASSFTFNLRKGMKWSNGMDFTAADIAFMINDVLPDDKLFPAKPSWLLVDGKLPKATIDSPTSITITFDGPNGLFIKNVAGVFGTQLTLMSKDYCSRYMPKFNPKAVDLAKADGASGWVEELTNKCGLEIENIQRWRNPDMPVLGPWKIVQPYVSGASQVTFTRNPYYFKVDPKGQQLPYLDGARLTINADVQTVLLSALAGKINYQERHIGINQYRAVLTEGEQKGNYTLVNRVPANASDTAFSFNLTHKDPVLRKIFDTKDFRIAMSEAIDRPSIIDAVYLGLTKPKQVAPGENTIYANKRLAEQYTKYDVKEANRLLDSIGLDKRDAQGFRLRPDGKRLTFTVIAPAGLTGYSDVAELVVRYWQQVGVDARFQSVDRTRFYDIKSNNNQDVTVWSGEGYGVDALLDPRSYMPYSQESNFAIAWANTYLGLPGGEEPPPAVKKQWALYAEIKQTSDSDKQTALFKQILDIAADQFYEIGISDMPQQFAVKANDLHNVMAVAPTSWIYPSPAPSNTEQWFIQK